MRPTFLVEKAGNKLAVASLILGILTVLTAALFHFFSYIFQGILDNTAVNIFISLPVVLGILSILTGVISLRQVMTRNLFGREKAIVGIVVGSLIVVGLVIFLFYFYS